MKSTNVKNLKAISYQSRMPRFYCKPNFYDYQQQKKRNNINRLQDQTEAAAADIWFSSIVTENQ